MKVSFNLGADTTLIHFGLSQGVNNLAQALVVEKERLESGFGLAPGTFDFVDGSGGGETAATSASVAMVLQRMARSTNAQVFREGLPRLAQDGTLEIIQGFLKDSTLTGAAGNVMAKTGTFATLSQNGLIALRARAMAGYIQTRSGRLLTFVLNVNDAGEYQDFLDTVEVNEDLGTISAIIWRDY